MPHLDLGPEGVGVALEDGLDRGLADLLALLVVAAVDAVAVVAVAPAGEALAVQLQAARVLAVAVLLDGPAQRDHLGHLGAGPRPGQAATTFQRHRAHAQHLVMSPMSRLFHLLGACGRSVELAA